MADKFVTVSEQTHERLTAWKDANGSMRFDFLIARALDALAASPNGMVLPAEPDEPAQQPDS